MCCGVHRRWKIESKTAFEHPLHKHKHVNLRVTPRLKDALFLSGQIVDINKIQARVFEWLSIIAQRRNETNTTCCYWNNTGNLSTASFHSLLSYERVYNSLNNSNENSATGNLRGRPYIYKETQKDWESDRSTDYNVPIICLPIWKYSLGCLLRSHVLVSKI